MSERYIPKYLLEDIEYYITIVPTVKKIQTNGNVASYLQDINGYVLNIEGLKTTMSSFDPYKLGSLKEIDIYVERDETFGSIESTKTVVDLISPVSGTVININEDINDDIGIINSDPHDMGWLIVIEMSDLEQLEDLLVATAYLDFIMQEEESD